jgi:hypothetical protein
VAHPRPPIYVIEKRSISACLRALWAEALQRGLRDTKARGKWRGVRGTGIGAAACLRQKFLVPLETS